MRIGELPRLDLELVVPIAAAYAFQHIAGQGQGSWLPLFENVAVFMQHEPRVLEKFRSAAAQIDAPAASCRNGTAMQTHEQRMLDDPYVSNLLPEQQLERCPHILGYRNRSTYPHAPSFACDPFLRKHLRVKTPEHAPL